MHDPYFVASQQAPAKSEKEASQWDHAKVQANKRSVHNIYSGNQWTNGCTGFVGTDGGFKTNTTK